MVISKSEKKFEVENLKLKICVQKLELVKKLTVKLKILNICAVKLEAKNIAQEMSPFIQQISICSFIVQKIGH